MSSQPSAARPHFGAVPKDLQLLSCRTTSMLSHSRCQYLLCMAVAEVAPQPHLRLPPPLRPPTCLPLIVWCTTATDLKLSRRWPQSKNIEPRGAPNEGPHESHQTEKADNQPENQATTQNTPHGLS